MPAPADLAQALRALRWLLLSPPLLDTRPGCFGAPVQRFSPAQHAAIGGWLEALAADPTPLADFLAGVQPDHGGLRSLRLGRQAEQLMGFFLGHGPTHRLLAAHLPLRAAAPGGGVRTLGEIDFLLRDLVLAAAATPKAGPVDWHWELAVKFYLYRPPPQAAPALADPAHCVGPDGRDSLAAKLQRLFGHQLRQPVPCLPGEAAPRHWARAALLRGWIFYPWGQAVPAVAGLNPSHLRGRWLQAQDLGRCPGHGWHPLPHSDWLAPFEAAPGDAGGTAQSAWQAGATPGRAVMLVRCVHRLEVQRLVVVP